MKTVLVSLNARFAHSSLALRYLKQYNAEFDIVIKEFSINDSLEHMYSILLKEQGDIYGFSCYIWNLELTLKLAEMIKTALPECMVFLGGPEAGYRAKRLLHQHPFVDMVMVGEGEETLREMLTTDVKNLSDVQGLAMRNAPFTPREPMDLTAMPQPYTKEDIQANKEKILYFETSR
jgi:anaerobic magnesium-protoporphyrin IX monomethyl ester cyclase